MKHFIIALLLIGGTAIAQTVFTNTMVFNYNVGDTFIYEGNGPGAVVLKVITSKNYSANGDTVKYGTWVFQRYYAIGPQGAQTITMSSTPVEIFCNLSDTLIPSVYFPSTFYGSNDSTFNDNSYCGISTYHAKSYPFINNFEPKTWECKYTLGLGRTYYYTFDPTTLYGSVTYWLNMVYHHKVGGPSCGNASKLSVGIDRQTLGSVAFEIYPNPSGGDLFINSSEKILTMRMTDLNGRTFDVKVDNDRVEWDGLRAGLYVITALNGRPINLKKIIKSD